jgi:hypothetical protein
LVFNSIVVLVADELWAVRRPYHGRVVERSLVGSGHVLVVVDRGREAGTEVVTIPARRWLEYPPGTEIDYFKWDRFVTGEGPGEVERP